MRELRLTQQTFVFLNLTITRKTITGRTEGKGLVKLNAIGTSAVTVCL